MIVNALLVDRKKALTDVLDERTLTGGKAGSGEREAPRVSSAEDLAGDATTLAMCLDALVAMWHAKNESDRESLDKEFETLVGCIEEWRDAVPKA